MQLFLDLFEHNLDHFAPQDMHVLKVSFPGLVSLGRLRNAVVGIGYRVGQDSRTTPCFLPCVLFRGFIHHAIEQDLMEVLFLFRIAR